MTRQLARIALYTGQPLDQIAQSELIARAFVEEQSEFWPMHYELLALIAEQQSALLVAFLRAYGAKNVGKPISIPRPDHTMLGRLGEPGAKPDIRVSEDAPAGDNVVPFSKFLEMLDDKRT